MTYPGSYWGISVPISLIPSGPPGNYQKQNIEGKVVAIILFIPIRLVAARFDRALVAGWCVVSTGGKAFDDTITRAVPCLGLVAVECRQRVRSTMRCRSAFHPRRAAAQLRRMPELADRSVVDEAATVGCLLLILIFFCFIISFIAGKVWRTANFLLRWLGLELRLAVYCRCAALSIV